MDLTPFRQCRAHKNAIFVSNEIEPYRPCCWFEGKIDATSFSEYQQKLSEIDIEKACRFCIDIEKNGGKWSHRQHFEAEDPNEILVSISFDNLCNLKCITCFGTNSSQLALESTDRRMKKIWLEIQKHGPKKTEFVKNFLTESNISTLRIEVLGGEPLLNPSLYKFLDWLGSQPYARQTRVNITTNGTTYDTRLEKYVDQFDMVNIQMSIDGIDDVYEYIRFGGSFDTFKETLYKFHTLKNSLTDPNRINIGFCYTLSWMNSLHIEKFFNWLYTDYPQYSQNVFISKLEGPVFYSINVLPIDARKQIVEKVKESIINKDAVKTGLDFYIQHMATTEELPMSNLYLHKGIKHLKKNDELPKRNSSVFKTFESIFNFLNIHDTD